MRHAPVSPRVLERRLARALTASATRAGLVALVERHHARPWASATFAGCRHDIVVAAPRDARLEGWIAALPHAELDLPGHLVASIAVEGIEDDGVTVRLTLSALTIEGA